MDQTEQNTASQIDIQEYTFQDFLRKAQKLIQEGYVFDFDTNDNVPVRYGFVHCAKMLKQAVKTEEVPAAKVRKKKTEVESTEIQPEE